jgi:hypothetical protein
VHDWLWARHPKPPTEPRLQLRCNGFWPPVRILRLPWAWYRGSVPCRSGPSQVQAARRTPSLNRESGRVEGIKVFSTFLIEAPVKAQRKSLWIEATLTSLKCKHEPMDIPTIHMADRSIRPASETPKRPFRQGRHPKQPIRSLAASRTTAPGPLISCRYASFRPRSFCDTLLLGCFVLFVSFVSPISFILL